MKLQSRKHPITGETTQSTYFTITPENALTAFYHYHPLDYRGCSPTAKKMMQDAALAAAQPNWG